MFTSAEIYFPNVFEGYEKLLCELTYLTGPNGTRNFVYVYYNPNMEFGDQTLSFIKMYDGRWAVTLEGNFDFQSAYFLLTDHIKSRRETKTFVGNHSKLNSEKASLIAHFNEDEIPALMERFVSVR